MFHRFFSVLALGAVCAAQPNIPLDWRAVLNSIRESSIRGHVEFLASDLLRGRATPSPGLDIAAAYIASQFERAGVEPLPSGSYYQDTPATVWQPAPEFSLTMQVADRTWRPRPVQVRYWAAAAVNYRQIPAPVVPLAADAEVPDIDPGRVVILLLPEGATYESLRLVRKAVDRLDPALAIIVDSAGAFMASGTVNRPRTDSEASEPPARLIVHDPALGNALRSLPAGAVANVSLQAEPAVRRTFPLRNVAGIVRGSDPVLRDTYVLVSAHYDHVGWLGPGAGDRVFNGANDDASGTAAVLEMAAAVARMPVRPARSILFCAFAGEEGGLLGSRAMMAHPPVPLRSVVGGINLEVLGRVEGAHDGAKAGRAMLTGFNFTSIGAVLTQAGKDMGVEMYRHPEYSDAFFDRSDNLSLAEKGIPAHTIASSFIYPGYHTPADEADTLDYMQITRVTRATALGVLRIAADAQPPTWSADAEVEKYRNKR